MSVAELIPLLEQLPECCIEPIVELVKGALENDDPERFIKRRITADTAHAASEAALQAALHDNTE